MKYTLFFLILLISACGQQKKCEENIKSLFDSKYIGECVVSLIIEENPRVLCYYSNVLYRIKNYRYRFRHDEKLRDLNMHDLLEDSPQHLYNLYKIVGTCNMTHLGDFLQEDMKRLLDDYKDGKFPLQFYLGCASKDSVTSENTDYPPKILKKIKQDNKRIKNRKIIKSYKQWSE